jgi:DNA-directed RNA polymerase specialized sigma subunit
LWIDYKEDLNCTEIAVQKNDKMILREIGDRLKLTPSRIKQIQNEAIKKITNRIIQITD